ncbi:kinase-like domain-containing protein [Roridomyces roridus]|uniref:non-specific serine/threonine protein kinase n=1 Tax=Roridomyces roridus TaxID=1738132 RepID=A0AAD7CJC3_9AGAR|nr:kinase-like domain-containing protein [Roridomyces roridus]
MESSEELQQLELTALRSIYAEDFIQTPPPKAWKGAPRLHEFTIRVPHPDAAHASKICFNLHVIFPKTYPAKASPTFTIEKPLIGISNDQITTLSQAIQSEARLSRGAEMTFQIVTFCQDWLTSHVVPPIDIPGSLANQMTLRALEEERRRKQKEADEAEQELERAAKAAQELEAAVKADAQRQQLEKERQYIARKRASSEATEVPVDGYADMLTESFSEPIVVDNVQFHAVRIFHPQRERLGTTYTADPICDDMNVSLPLQLCVVAFASNYYITSQGKKKLKQVEAEIRRLIPICHQNLQRIFAVKMTFPHTSGPPRLTVLHEAAPASTLRDLLEDCDSLKESRASEYLVQILSGLNAIHAADLIHRGIAPDCIGITVRNGKSKGKVAKLMKVAFYTRLLDLHRSNPFGPGISVDSSDEPRLPDQWLSKDVKTESALLYTRHRDIHAVGIVLMQMLLGLDVADRYLDAYAAIRASEASPNTQRHALNMLFPSKKNQLSCLSLLADLSDAPLSIGIPVVRSPQVPPYDVRTPMPGTGPGSSPEIEFFRGPQRDRQSSRWKEDWEELELLGKGSFGSVVKARNRIDSRVYAVKKVRLSSTTRTDTKIFREVNALSRLSHRFIVRYFTTWVETAEAASAAVSDESGTESGTEDGTSVPTLSESRSRISSSDHITFDLDDLDDVGSGSRSSFPSIHFSRSSSPRTDDGEGEESENESDGLDVAFEEDMSLDKSPATPPLVVSRTLYIQMEFVERQTLKERISDGLSEEEAWRLFQQILEALVYMSSSGILHRDIKLTNIFIDAKGDCKVGDFGLATSNLSAAEPQHSLHHPVTHDAEMTLEVGTRLYIAPEVQSRKRGPRNHTKADMYSLGIVFFEMNYKFTTGSERIAVIEDLRRPLVIFPASWDSRLTRQRQIITCLLDHDPDTRPTALELSQSPLLPSRLEDEYFKGALGVMVKPDSPHYQAVLSSLFSQAQPPARRFLYDVECDLPEHAALNDIVKERLAYIFRLHGAVDMEPPLLMPVVAEDKNQASFIDRFGEVVGLPTNLLVPFARLAAKGQISRIKRYHIGNVYREVAVAGHPKFQKAALLDIITTDITFGPIAAAAEIIAVANECLDSFPNLNENYQIHISHSSIVRIIFDRIPSDLHASILEIINHSKSSSAQKRALLLKKGLSRSMVDELEAMADPDEDIDALMVKLEKVSLSLTNLLRPIVEEVKETIQYAILTGVARPILFYPLMLGSHHTHFKNGILVEVVRKNKRTDVLAAGGRYDGLIREQATPGQKIETICAISLQIAVEKITLALAAYQVSSVRTLIKQEHSFGFWSPRRCDVYVVSFQPGHLQDRLEVVAFLWQHNISADLMYESSIPESEHESHLDMCSREGVLFTVYPRPRTGLGRRDQVAFKVKSILKGTEYELSRQEIVGWLHQQIAEQKRVDANMSGAVRYSESTAAHPLPNKETVETSGVQLILPVDVKKQRKQVKQLFMDRAFETGLEVESGIHAGMPILAVDVLPAVFDSMVKSPAWLCDEEAWKALAAAFPPQQGAYAQQVREAVLKRKGEGHRYILLFAVREERVQLLKTM